MNVTTQELRRAANLLLDHLEASGQTEFKIDEDFYWNIPQEQLYNPYDKPTDLDMGQLSDDLGEIRKIVNDESPCVGYALVWLAPVCRRVGEKAVG